MRSINTETWNEASSSFSSVSRPRGRDAMKTLRRCAVNIYLFHIYCIAFLSHCVRLTTGVIFIVNFFLALFNLNWWIIGLNYSPYLIYVIGEGRKINRTATANIREREKKCSKIKWVQFGQHHNGIEMLAIAMAVKCTPGIGKKTHQQQLQQRPQWIIMNWNTCKCASNFTIFFPNRTTDYV